jgi:hypothetical protein
VPFGAPAGDGGAEPQRDVAELGIRRWEPARGLVAPAAYPCGTACPAHRVVDVGQRHALEVGESGAGRVSPALALEAVTQPNLSTVFTAGVSVLWGRPP